MKQVINIILITLMCISCTQEEGEFNTREAKPPLINKPSPFTVTAYQYIGKIVIADEGGYYSSPYLTIYNCDGSLAFGPGEYNKFTDKRKKIKLLYEFKR